MICTYASSSDAGKLHPLGTVLCNYMFVLYPNPTHQRHFPVAFINEVLPVDPKQSRYIRIKLGLAAQPIVNAVEFDTAESAQDWRRELNGRFFWFRIPEKIITFVLPKVRTSPTRHHERNVGTGIKCAPRAGLTAYFSTEKSWNVQSDSLKLQRHAKLSVRTNPQLMRR